MPGHRGFDWELGCMAGPLTVGAVAIDIVVNGFPAF